MWMDAYVHEVLIRQQIRDAQQRAAQGHALTNAKRVEGAGRVRGRFRHAFHAVAGSRLKQLVARVVVS